MSRRSRGARRLAALAVAAPLARAGAGGAAFATRAAVAQRRGTSMYPDVPNPAPTVALAAAVALDELFNLPIGVLGSIVPARDYEQSSAELDNAVRYYDTRSWLDDPAGYFVTPPTPHDVELRSVSRRRGPLQVMRFASSFVPHPGEPGAGRWQSFASNRDAYAAMLRHDGVRQNGDTHPWLVAIHGQGMGRLADIDFMRLRRIHEELGVNVALPVLPLHGPRRQGFGSEQQFVSGAYPVNNVLGLAQSVWDVRRLLAWLREHERASSIAVYGLSLGSYVASLLSTLDDDLACVIAVVPSGDLAEALRSAEPAVPQKRRLHRMVHDRRSALVHRVVSPLAAPCRVPKDRRFIIAGLGDRVARPPGAVLLWRHWDQCAIRWRARGHLTTAVGADHDAHIAGILRTSDLVPSAWRPAR